MNDERAGVVMRELCDLAGALTDYDADLLRDAANEIQRLRAALKPFATIWHERHNEWSYSGLTDATAMVRALDLRDAFRVLK